MPVYGFGPGDSPVFRLLSDLCSIRTSLHFQHDHTLEALTNWAQNHQSGALVMHVSMLARLTNRPKLQEMFKRFTLVVVNDDQAALATASEAVGTAHLVVGKDCKFADLPMVLLDPPQSCKVIKQCN
jgi:hypothetical protein